ncbi:MAG: flagellar motor switch protein FliN [Geminicoccaceae bacterium]
MSSDSEKLDLNELTASDAPPGDDVEMAADAPPSTEPQTAVSDEDGGGAKCLGAIYDVPVQVSAVLGKTSMPISQLIRLGRGAVLELDRKVGESIDVVVNNRLVARGEVVIVDERIGITMTEIIKSDG